MKTMNNRTKLKRERARLEAELQRSNNKLRSMLADYDKQLAEVDRGIAEVQSNIQDIYRWLMNADAAQEQELLSMKRENDEMLEDSIRLRNEIIAARERCLEYIAM